LGTIIDVAILGSGLAGLGAAYALRDLDVQVFESDDDVGGRTRSETVGDGFWMNYGAQYITPDKTRIVELADELGVPLVTVTYPGSYKRSRQVLSPAHHAEVDGLISLLERAQAEGRADAAELDRQTFAEWLGDLDEGVAMFWENWCYGLINGSMIETSTYGAMWLWGDQRTSPWTDDDVPRHQRGDCVVSGGTQRLAHALAGRLGGKIRLGHTVTGVQRVGDGYRITADHDGSAKEFLARKVVCALPAPVALNVIQDLPAWKSAALRRVRYGRYMATPVLVAPEGALASTLTIGPSRPGQTYNSNWFALRTPTDPDLQGAAFHAWLDDRLARQVWDDPDETLRSGVARAFLKRFPHYDGRITRIGLRRWRFGLPQYYRGRMADAEELAAPSGDIFFCGDYTSAANMEGALRSGELAARQILG
jgi:oxygen-dependent protoporphyrinogen oxidase